MAVIGFRKRVLETREPLLFHTVTPEILEQYDQPKVIQGEPARSGVFVPLVVGGRATGVISLQNVDREHAFDDADLRLLTTLAGSLSVALENARLFEETRQRNAELALINDVQRGLAENLEMQTMYDLVGDRLQEIFDAQVVDIGVLDEVADLHPLPLHRSSEASGSPTSPIEVIGFRRHVLETREPYLARRDTLDEQSATVRSTSRPSRGATQVFPVRPSRRRREGDRRDLASEPRPRARLQRRGRSTPHDARGEPQRRARERSAVRGDPAAQRRARAHQRRPARPRREPRDAGDVRPGRGPDPGHLRRAGGQYRDPRRSRRTHPLRLRDRTRDSLPHGSDRDPRLPEESRSRRESRSSSTTTSSDGRRRSAIQG